MKLRVKFSFFSSLLVILIITASSSFLFVAEKKVLIKEMEEHQLTVAKGFAQVSRESLVSKDQISLLNYIKALKQERDVAYAVLTDVRGKVVAHSDIALLGGTVQDGTGMQTLGAEKLLVQRFVNKDRREIVDVAIPLYVNGAKTALARVGFARDVQQEIIRKTLTTTRNRIFGVAGAALLIGILASFLLAHIMTRPIKKMADGARLFGKGKLDAKIDVRSKDELGALADDLNLMADRLKELDQRKQDFVSSVTHELRSPITSMSVSIELFLDGAMGDITPDQKSMLQIVLKNITRLSHFVNDLLDIAKIERGKMEIHPYPADVAVTIKDTIELAKAQADAKSISIDVDIPGTLPKAFIDGERVQQVVTNLLSNAVKFTPDKGTITVKAADPGGDFIQISVRDTGIGIPRDQTEKIFEKFEQAKGVRDKVKGQKGTGLGLAIAKAIVELHGGTIWVESEPDKGSCFYFTLPKVKPNEPPNPAAAPGHS